MIEHDMIPCPKCGSGGPHDRVGVTPGGLSVQMRCWRDRCKLVWTITG